MGLLYGEELSSAAAERLSENFPGSKSKSITIATWQHNHDNITILGIFFLAIDGRYVWDFIFQPAGLTFTNHFHLTP